MLRTRWSEFVERVVVPPAFVGADELFEKLDTLYRHPPRAYHNLAHIAACLTLFDRHCNLAERRDEVELALWLHDAVYEPGRTDNERRSADVGSAMASLLGWSDDAIERVALLIVATQHAQRPETPDQRLIVDIDLSILAAEPGEYAGYARAIRAEYAHVSDEAFRAERAAFIDSMLERPRIFHTPELAEAFEQRARKNLRDERRR